jgi:large subunit ribosomal protein L10e
MGRRRWRCTAEIKSRKGYQKKRSRSHRKEFVRGGADPKIRMYDIGNKSKDDWDVVIALVVIGEPRKISHFALEAIRISVNRKLQADLGRTGFYMKIRKHPHFVWREHTQLGFAGADRISTGMRNAFGKPIGRCAIVKPGDILFQVGVDLKGAAAVKDAVRIARYKVCTQTKIVLMKAKSPEIANKVPLPRLEQFVF